LGLFQLLGDGHLETRLQQLAQVAGEGVVRDAAHGGLHVLVVPPPGEHHPQHRRSLFRVLEEQLVKIPQPEEQQRIGVLLLQLQVLLEHRRLLHSGPL